MNEDLVRAVTGGAVPRIVETRCNGLDLRCHLWGSEDRPPVLLIHGAGVNAHWWDPLLPSLADAFYVIVPDLRGHGASAPAPDGGYGLEDFTADLLSLLSQIGVRGPFALGGHSMGGRVASRMAIELGNRISRLALIDTRLGPIAAERVERWRGVTTGRGERQGLPSREAAMARFRLTPEESGISPEVLTNLAYHGVRERTPGDWVIGFDRAVLRLEGSRVSDLMPDLRLITAPTLVLRGRESAIISERQFAEVGEALRSCSGWVFEGGHHFALVHPQSVGSLLRRHFAAAQ